MNYIERVTKVANMWRESFGSHILNKYEHYAFWVCCKDNDVKPVDVLAILTIKR